MKNWIVLVVSVFALAAVPAALAGPDGSQAPIHNGCMPGYHILSVAGLTAEGYGVPALLDTGGNDDGYVCGERISEALAVQLCGGEHGPGAACPVPVVYDFTDNDQ